MKKKFLTQIMVLSFALGGLFVVGNNVFADDSTTKPPGDQGGGGGNTATCYSSWQEPGWFQKGTWIWVCGDCENQVKSVSHFDSGICYF